MKRQKLLNDDPSVKYEFYSPSANRWFVHTIDGQKMSRAVYIYLKVHNLPALPKGFVVHHLNGDSADDIPDNFLLVSRSQHGTLARRKALNYRRPIRPLATTETISGLIKGFGLETPTWCELTPVGLKKLREPTRDELSQTAALLAALGGRRGAK